MENRSLFNERNLLFRNAVRMEKNKRIPHLSNFWTWKILDSEYKLSEAFRSYDIMEKVVSDFQERYQFDGHYDLGTRNPVRVTDALGVGYHLIDDENESITVIDHAVMERDEYNDCAQDPARFYWSDAFARYCPDLTMEQLQKGAQEFMAFGQYNQTIRQKIMNEYQCPIIAPTYIKLPFEIFYTVLRGIKELSIDLRKSKEELKNAMEALYEFMVIPLINTTLTSDTSPYVCDGQTVLFGQNITSIKQFEELYWPIFKRVYDQLAAAGKTLYIFCEGELMRFTDFFQDIPKGSLMIHLEQDNIFEMRKKLPNICFAGGMTTDLLGHGTKQQCMDYTKKLVDELGEGFVLSQNKMMSFRNDCTRENLLSVCDFIRNYNC